MKKYNLHSYLNKQIDKTPQSSTPKVINKQIVQTSFKVSAEFLAFKPCQLDDFSQNKLTITNQTTQIQQLQYKLLTLTNVDKYLYSDEKQFVLLDENHNQLQQLQLLPQQKSDIIIRYVNTQQNFGSILNTVFLVFLDDFNVQTFKVQLLGINNRYNLVVDGKPIETLHCLPIHRNKQLIRIFNSGKAAAHIQIQNSNDILQQLVIHPQTSESINIQMENQQLVMVANNEIVRQLIEEIANQQTFVSQQIKCFNHQLISIFENDILVVELERKFLNNTNIE